jgi:hypothetical protein
MCLAVQRYRRNLMAAGARAQAQSALGGDAAEAAFKDFTDLLTRVEKQDTEGKMRKKLAQLAEIKEIRFKPLSDGGRKNMNLPTVSADTLRKSGKLTEQIRPVQPNRPSRARAAREFR